jgi:hypothetical protein
MRSFFREPPPVETLTQPESPPPPLVSRWYTKMAVTLLHSKDPQSYIHPIPAHQILLHAFQILWTFPPCRAFKFAYRRGPLFCPSRDLVGTKRQRKGGLMYVDVWLLGGRVSTVPLQKPTLRGLMGSKRKIDDGFLIGGCFLKVEKYGYRSYRTKEEAHIIISFPLLTNSWYFPRCSSANILATVAPWAPLTNCEAPKFLHRIEYKE